MNVTVSVSKGKSFGIMDRVIIEGRVNEDTVFTATKTGDMWEYNMSGLCTNEKERMTAWHEAIEQVKEKAKEFE